MPADVLVARAIILTATLLLLIGALFALPAG